MRAWLLPVLLLGCVEGGGDVEDGVDASIRRTDARADTRSETSADGGECDPAADPCPPDQHCSPLLRQCIAGCRADAGCAKGRCDVANHECVGCLGNGDCPVGEVCAGSTCVAGCTPERPCAAGLTCCSGGCIDPATNLDHCGGCGNKCTVANASAKCAGGKCGIGSCKAPFGDCDGNAGNGCETDTSASRDHCGGCGNVCAPKNGTGACALGACKVATCTAGFGDCNGSGADGCEADLTSDPANCGSCGGKPAEKCNLRDDNCNGRCDDLDGCRRGIHRSVGPKEHFYTDSATEAACCGFTVENLNYFYLYADTAPDTVPFYRCYNKASGLHFYTASSTCESGGSGAVESVMGHIGTRETCGAVPLFRLWNKTSNDHLFTIDPAERDKAKASGWIEEGAAGWVWRAPRG